MSIPHQTQHPKSRIAGAVIATVLACVAAPRLAAADDAPLPYESTIDQCVPSAAATYKVDPRILTAIIDVEGGKAGACEKNKNGTTDCGPAQVNTVNRDELAQTLKVSRADLDEWVTASPCYNAFIAAWILKREIVKAGDNVWEGVGRYHSRTPSLKAAYQTRIVNAIIRRYGKQAFEPKQD